VHKGVQDLDRDLNKLHQTIPALHARDCEDERFPWTMADDRDQSVVAWARFGAGRDLPVVMVTNFTPTPRLRYKMRVRRPGWWREILNTDASVYGGSAMGNFGAIFARDEPSRVAYLPAPNGPCRRLHSSISRLQMSKRGAR
jgi:1,4-alpha-glucan branching enzyme